MPATIHITATGTKTTGTSTPGDWTDQQSYSIANFALACAAASDEDHIIFDNGIYTSPDFSLNNSPTGLLYVESRNGATIINPTDGATRLFTYASATADSQFVLQDLIFDLDPFAWTVQNNSIISITQNCSRFDMLACTWKNLITSTIARTTGLLVRVAPNIAGVTVSIEDNIFQDMDLDFSGDFQGLFKSEDNDITWSFDGNTFRRIDANCSAGNNLGLVYQTNTTALTLNNSTVNTVVMAAASGQSVAGLYRAQGSPGALTVDGLVANDCTLSGLAATEGLIKVIGSATVKNVTVDNLRRTGTASGGGNSIGGVVSAQGTSASAVLEDITVTNSGGFFGTVCYNSGGSVIVARRCIAIGITDDGQVGATGDPVNGLAFYSGGNGNATWDTCIAYACEGDAENGLAFYGHLTNTGGDTDKTILIANCGFWGSLSTGTKPAGYISSQLAGFTLTCVVRDTLFDNGANNIEFVQNAGTLTVSGANNHITGGIGSVTITSGTVDLGTLTTGDPLIGEPTASTPPTIGAASPILNAGGHIVTTLDAYGRLRRNPPSIGPVERLSGQRIPASTRVAATR